MIYHINGIKEKNNMNISIYRKKIDKIQHELIKTLKLDIEVNISMKIKSSTKSLECKQYEGQRPRAKPQ